MDKISRDPVPLKKTGYEYDLNLRGGKISNIRYEIRYYKP